MTTESARAWHPAPLPFDGTLDGLRAVSLSALAKVSPESAAAMNAVGIGSVHDLLLHVPRRRYIDLSAPVSVASVVAGDVATVAGTVSKVVHASV